MANVESLIVGREKLIRIFGYWPSFHDAEVLELNFWRGDVQPDKGIYDFPVLTLKVHLWELTTKTDTDGYLITRYHTLTTLKFYDVDDFQMAGFNHQNAMMGLVLSHEERKEAPSPYFAVKIDPAFGMGASFKCLRIELSAAVSCTDEGIAICEDTERE